MDDDKKETLGRLGHAELVAFETELVNQIVKELAVEPSPAPQAPAVEIHGDTVADDREKPPERPQYEKDWYHGLDRQRALPGIPFSVMNAIGEREAAHDRASESETFDEPVEDERHTDDSEARESAAAEHQPEPPPERPEVPEQLLLGLPLPEDELVREFVQDEGAEVFDEIVEQPRAKKKGESAVVSSGKQVAILPQYFEEAFELDLAPSIRNLEYLMIGALIISCLVTSLALLRLGGSKAFPILAHGSYVGKIQGLGEEEDAAGFFLESMPGDRYLFVIARPEWGSQLLDFSNETRVKGGISPVMLTSASGSIRFVGEELADGRFGGSILNDNGRAFGEWRLSAISDMQDDLPPVTEEHTKAWYQMRAALRQLGERIAVLEPTLEEQQREIVRLTEFITEEEKLKRRADEKFDSIKVELTSLQETLKAKRKEAKALERQFDVSQRVKGLGRLVSLARDSLQREADWIEIMERSVIEEYPRDFEEEYRRALKIQEIKRQIAREKERIAAVSKAAKSGPPTPALSTRREP